MPAQNDLIEDFAIAAQRFCAWVEGKPRRSGDEVLLALSSLAVLYSSALRLPPATSLGGAATETSHVVERSGLRGRFAAFPVRQYSAYFYPADGPGGESVTADLVDDLSDIYCDVKRGALLLDEDRAGDALWEWKDGFRLHWGRHAVTALWVLHCYAEKEGLLGSL